MRFRDKSFGRVRLSLSAVLCASLALAPALALAGCGGGAPADADAAKQEVVADPSEKGEEDAPAGSQAEGSDAKDADEAQGDAKGQEAVTEEADPGAEGGTTDEATDVEAKAADKPEGDATAKAEASKDTKSKGDPKLAQKLGEDLAGVAENAGMDMRVTVVDLPTGTWASHKGDEQMVSASMIKMIIAYTALAKSEEGAFALDDVYELQGSDIVGGTGVLQGRGAGAQVSYADLIHYMISESDNVATNVLIDTVGMDAVNEQAKALGLSCTRLGRKMMDFDAQAAGQENYVSADDLAKLFQMVHEKTFVSEDGSALVLKALEAQGDWGGVLRGLPEGTVFAHKTGTLDTVRHDGGIVEGEHPYVIVVLCGGEGYYEEGALALMGQVASVVNADVAG